MTLTIEIGILISILGLIVAYQSYQLNKQKQQFEQMKLQMEQQKDVKSETKNDAKESAELKAELGYIRRGVDDIKIDLKANERQMQALGERVTRVEESSKQAHKRLDQMEKESV